MPAAPAPTAREKEGGGAAAAAGPRAKKQVLFVLQLCAFELSCIDHPRKSDARCALHVVVVDAVLVAVSLEQVNGIRPGPILKVDAAFRKNLLHCLDELVDKRV